MEKTEIRERAIAERPDEADYLRAFFALIDYSNYLEVRGDKGTYEVNKLIWRLEGINAARVK